MQTHLAHQALLDFIKQDRTIKVAFDAMRTMREIYHAKTPLSKEPVFFPSSMLYEVHPYFAIAHKEGLMKQGVFKDMTDTQRHLLNLFWGIHLFGAWRNTLSIYKIDDDVIDSVITAPIPAETPVSLFKRLPEWSVYIDLSNSTTRLELVHNDQIAHLLGFWATYDYRGDTLVLNIVPHTDVKFFSMYSHYHPLTLYIYDDMTIHDVFEHNIHAINQLAQTEGFDVFKMNHQAKADYRLLSHLLSCLLWLCAEEPEIHHKNEPLPKEKIPSLMARHKKTGVFIPPSAPKIFELGKRMGAEVRTYKEAISAYDSDKKSGKTVSRKRPHIRRAHWHGYWTGSGQGREFKLKWIPTTFVNG